MIGFAHNIKVNFSLGFTASAALWITFRIPSWKDHYKSEMVLTVLDRWHEFCSWIVAYNGKTGCCSRMDSWKTGWTFPLSTVPLSCVNPGAMGVTTCDGISTYDPCLPTVPQRYVSIALGTSPHTCIFKAAQSKKGQLNKCKLNELDVKSIHQFLFVLQSLDNGFHLSK